MYTGLLAPLQFQSERTHVKRRAIAISKSFSVNPCGTAHQNLFACKSRACQCQHARDITFHATRATRSTHAELVLHCIAYKTWSICLNKSPFSWSFSSIQIMQLNAIYTAQHNSPDSTQLMRTAVQTWWIWPSCKPSILRQTCRWTQRPPQMAPQLLQAPAVGPVWQNSNQV